MLRFVILSMALLIFVTITLALLFTTVVFLAFACAVGLPLWLTTRRWLQRHGLIAVAQRPIDHLRSLYVEGKIDLWEFERRLSRLLAAERY